MMPPENDVAAADDASTSPQKPPRRSTVARCLFGKPDQDELANMGNEMYQGDKQKMMDKYGVDMDVLTQRDDIDILVVQVRAASPEPEVDVANLNLDTESSDAAEGDPPQESPLTPGETTP